MQTLQEINKALEDAYKDLPLVSKPEDVVPGEGDISATIMMIGEAPGFHETVERRPFVGRSGQLLRKVIGEVGLDLKDIYISNIVKARPPENRDPSPGEIKAYKPYLDKEIELIDPALIVTLGRYSMYKFLPDVKISQVHGRLHRVEWADRIKYILPMYHPAAALRGIRVKDQFVEDFSKINRIIKWLESNQTNYELESDIREALF